MPSTWRIPLSVILCVAASSGNGNGARAFSLGFRPDRVVATPPVADETIDGALPLATKTTTTTMTTTRRSCLERLLLIGSGVGFGFGVGAASTPALSLRLRPPFASAAMDPEDYGGEFIQKLKAKSEAKRTEYIEQSKPGTTGWTKLNSAKFTSQYDRPTYVGVRRKDMSYKMLSPEEVKELKDRGVIIAEYDMILDSMGNEVPDYKKGPVLQFATDKESL